MTSDKTVYALASDRVPDMLNGDEHFAYVAAMRTVPSARITRSPVRKLPRSSTGCWMRMRSANETNVNPFADVEEGMWFNTRVPPSPAWGSWKGVLLGSLIQTPHHPCRVCNCMRTV